MQPARDENGGKLARLEMPVLARAGRMGTRRKMTPTITET
jgi:hypothetical protein